MSRFDALGHWPKLLPKLSEEQKAIREDFYGVWLTEFPKRYELVARFNDQYALRAAGNRYVRTLDIGAGMGGHVHWEDLTKQEYVALELRQDLADRLRDRYPQVKAVVGDIQERTGFADGYFERILAIHVLEHLTDLPRALDEIKRILHPDGTFSVLIPCDPGFAYSWARDISARRSFERRYKQSYDWFVACEHINHWKEIIGELDARFSRLNQVYYPLRLPVVDLNLVIGLTLAHRK